MPSITRSQIEEYYKHEWSDLISQNAMSVLVDLTSKMYGLNKPLSVWQKKEEPKPQDLGQI